MPPGYFMLSGRVRAKDLSGTQLGEVTIVRNGFDGAHFVRCAHGHEYAISGHLVRSRMRTGEPLQCRDCKERKAS